MLEFDPLQHHGWFAMSESDLNNYPKTYLPPEVFPYCCSLTDSVELHITFPEENPADNSFFKLVNSLTKQLHSKYTPVNLFFVKSILSEFMMLPTLFIQQKTKTGIYKKLSFEKTRNYFTDKEWKVMDEVSDIRKNWDSSEAKLNFKTPCIISVAKKKIQKAHAPKVPENLSRIFQSGLATRMLDFIETMKKKIDET